ncbi:arsenate reductase family protein [Weeksella virosa]|uniref:Arsenate reductase like protein n=1 Tax=Weeksella virosa (strain ATCC 43766 / DSM 16922 / JCM 21250 / CCUG 30538 / CDC 9751 / IAM 14551 / NBRC 16016 / NCTC 11634 / CL345/78) TaxID=865938 RepID=F0P2M5_WEEVC|nr:ArsC/Spx/MgsR family protein [Weeksella virosa]ADX67864.1 arsenate reductase like protein [Weeksella virosa DSM 16922]SUP54167.1 transcriptional regulator Spx [Weeksella virosa]VEH64509.1 transcriptional regulator Spx [Weeksella virosa]
MKKIFYLKTCSTCKRILDTIPTDGFEMREIKSEPLTKKEVDDLQKLAKSYEALFSRRAQKYKTLGLKDKILNEQDYKGYILSDYTFLKRPVIVDGQSIFIGSDRKNIEALENHFK